MVELKEDEGEVSMNICGDDDCTDPDCPGTNRHPHTDLPPLRASIPPGPEPDAFEKLIVDLRALAYRWEDEGGDLLYVQKQTAAGKAVLQRAKELHAVLDG